ncbi:hypothetical protein [Abyssalbus ytuae]|uniref:Uncharacterized protein n=1 Tax=Abyssalbus ytuae TaxID=2926907 RepID=A0A9E7CV54_9FLAO|nr:hypothetical protein [Abyssalbus ytuae]UOB19407.1 hypothetical protein MQE35_08935 [Abyssalbus ytuae]
MSENIKPQNSSEEVDLGQLFKLIGDAFNKLFRFIGNIFKWIFHFLIGILIFVQKHFLKFAIAGLIGLIIGGILDYRKEPKYISKMVVEPNFQSVQQLYNDIDFYNELASSKDSVTLASSLNISVSEAASIKEIKSRSFSDENQKFKLFDAFLKTLDTTTRAIIDYKSFLDNFNTFDARFHEISIISTNSRVAKKTQGAIISSITNNDYFELQKKISDENIVLQEEIYKTQLQQIDSLQRFYREVMLKTAEKEGGGTTINLAGTKEDTKELELLKQIDILKENLVLLNQERANKANTLNVISAFPERGVEMKKVFDRYLFWCFGGAIAVMFLVLVLRELNRFLEKYQKNNMAK